MHSRDSAFARGGPEQRCFTRRTLAAALLLPCFAGCGSSSAKPAPEHVTVLAAASTIDALEEVAGLFKRTHAHERISIHISAGSSNGLARQVISGAPADVFLSANTKWADAVAAEGLTAESVDLLTNRLVLVVPRGNPANIRSLSDVGLSRVVRLAVAGENVPAGIYAEQALRRANLRGLLEEPNRLARGSDVRITLAYVERGEAEAGIVYATDARISGHADVVAELDSGTYDPVSYRAVLLKTGAGSRAARGFFEFLQSRQSLAVFSRHGFRPVAQP